MYVIKFSGIIAQHPVFISPGRQSPRDNYTPSPLGGNSKLDCLNDAGKLITFPEKFVRNKHRAHIGCGGSCRTIYFRFSRSYLLYEQRCTEIFASLQSESPRGRPIVPGQFQIDQLGHCMRLDVWNVNVRRVVTKTAKIRGRAINSGKLTQIETDARQLCRRLSYDWKQRSRAVVIIFA